MSYLVKQVEKVIETQKAENQKLNQQLEFLKQAQKAGVIKKPEYDVASRVYLSSPA
ncbi:hypothetical protein [Pseudidiomarina aestuarii]|uniref:hypothetical protein n=1 Tax=Pseudidiomarina aestuarii TaxID=624146 RepID=UPI0014760CF8|nr:hypothetical protein [Pseudidiomarina aestuarii]